MKSTIGLTPNPNALLSAALVALAFTPCSFGGPVTLHLVVNPPTTAGAGVPAAGGFNVTSTRSGSGTWHLFVTDEATGSFGIAQVKVQLTGTLPAINNRLTQTLYDTATDTGFKAGFTLLRSGTNVNPITASAELPGTQPYFQSGFGITPGNYSSIPGAILFYTTINGQWGNYNDGYPTSPYWWSFTPPYALFIAEGTYTGALPDIDLQNSFVAYYTNSSLTTSAQSTASSSNRLEKVVTPEPAPMSLIAISLIGRLRFGRRRG